MRACVCWGGWGGGLSDLRCLECRVLVDVLKSGWSILKGGFREPTPVFRKGFSDLCAHAVFTWVSHPVLD